MPEKIGPYQIIEELGRGAMGIVFRGRDTNIGRDVAIKVIRTQEFSTAAENAEARLRFTREASAAGRLSHPNIVTIYELGEERGYQYMAMEFVAGKSLEHFIITGTPVETGQALKILRPIADALDHAHSENVVHRDVKPANILVRPDGKVKITDFGIARVTSQTLTKTGFSMGTPAYMAPEQIMALKVDGLADQFSLAVMAYEMLGGRKPFEAETAQALMMKIINGVAEPIHQVNSGLPQNCSKVFEKALAKSSIDRYATCIEFIQALSDSLKSPPIEIRHPSVPDPGVTVVVSAWNGLRNAVILAAVIIGGLSLFWMYNHTPQTERIGSVQSGGPKAGEVETKQRPQTAEIESVQGGAPRAAPKEGNVETNQKDGQNYVFIPAGSFQMGCSLDDKECQTDEKPIHSVSISKPFWIGQTEVTSEAFLRFANAIDKPSPSTTRSKMPAVNVDWNDAKDYCIWVGGRLPTEAEWEYAARAGTKGARYGTLDSIAWYSGNSDFRARTVAQKSANGFRLYDMLGNVWEWTADWYDKGYYKASPPIDPKGPLNGTYRALRGGSWDYDSRYLRAAYRYWYQPSVRDGSFGFRCVLE